MLMWQWYNCTAISLQEKYCFGIHIITRLNFVSKESCGLYKGSTNVHFVFPILCIATI